MQSVKAVAAPRVGLSEQRYLSNSRCEPVAWNLVAAAPCEPRTTTIPPSMGDESWKDRGRANQRCRLAIGAVRPDADWALRVDAGLDDFLHPQSRAARSAAEIGCLSPGVSLLLWSLCLFEVKHFLCDFVLQTAYLYRNKGIYGHPAGFIHAGLHAVGSLPAILLLSRQPGPIALLAVAEFLIHYHVDWLKLHVDKRFRLGVNQRLYWAIFGADQLLHQFTYLGIIAVLTA